MVELQAITQAHDELFRPSLLSAKRFELATAKTRGGDVSAGDAGRPDLAHQRLGVVFAGATRVGLAGPGPRAGRHDTAFKLTDVSVIVRIGTRSSPMALAQAQRVIAEIGGIDGSVKTEVVPLTTSGDRWMGPLSALGGKGAFIKEVDAALLDTRCDLAVHCVKDIPGDRDVPEGTVIAAYLRRDDVRDAVIHPQGLSLSQLPDGSRVGTSSPRRLAQLALHWPRLRPVPIRGNANSRLAKLEAGEYDALLLAVSGLERIDLRDKISEILDTDTMLPAVGSGTLALQCREDDHVVRELVSRLADPDTTRQTEAERAMLRALRGHCHSPIGAHAQVEPGGGLTLQGRVISADGTTVLDSWQSGSDAYALGTAVAESLLQQGAREVIDAADERT